MGREVMVLEWRDPFGGSLGWGIGPDVEMVPWASSIIRLRVLYV